MRLLYFLLILIYPVFILLASPFNKKAKQWITGRRNWRKNLRKKINPVDKHIWVHCASLGEFEQGRPLMERIKETAPDYKIVLTFFSPSGFELRKNWPIADYIFYLPSDTTSNASCFIEIIRPSFVLFVKYEFWNNYISEIRRRNIPLYLVSGIFRPDQHFFKWYGRFFRNMLKKFTHIFVQDDRSVELLEGINIRNVSVSGDTRFDRVHQISHEALDLPLVDKFRAGEKLFLAGSSWKEDEEIISAYINSDPAKMKWVFAPHEVEKSNIERLEKLFKTSVIRYSQYRDNSDSARVMIIDNVGILASAYRYAYIAAVGGGFGKGIHNILEANCWGVPVLFGPDYKDYKEAVDLINMGGVFCYKNLTEFTVIMNNWLNNNNIYLSSSKIVTEYIQNNLGATEKILSIVMEKRY
jgi:3-deoxy-D-manno-octulosonic-acid transferase